MAFIWTKDLSVQVKEIDEQHQNFFRLANEVLGMLEEKEVTKEHAQHVLKQFDDYAHYHLRTEEVYFDRCHYPEADAHVAAHDAYRKTVAEAMERIEESEDYVTLILDITLFAGNWLTKHIRDMDQRYAECFHTCGLK